MKKLITLLTTLSLMAALAACGGNTQQISDGTDNAQQQKQNDGNTSGMDDSGDNQVMGEFDYLYGKITKITGNEMELAIVKMPEEDNAGGGEGGSEAVDIPDGGAAVALSPAQTIDPNDMADENVEYTGETFTLTIPAGVKIDNMGQEGSISTLKKGNLVFITVDNLEDRNIFSVSVMS